MKLLSALRTSSHKEQLVRAILPEFECVAPWASFHHDLHIFTSWKRQYTIVQARSSNKAEDFVDLSWFVCHRNLKLEGSSNLFNVNIWLTTEECVVSSMIAWYHILLELWMQDGIDMPTLAWLHASTDFHLRCTSKCFQFCPAQSRAGNLSWEHARKGSRVERWKCREAFVDESGKGCVTFWTVHSAMLESGEFRPGCFGGSQGRDSSRCLNSDA